MTESFKIPDEQTRKNSVENLKKVSQRLDILGLEMDELLAAIEAKLRCQRRECLERKYQH
ncbi:MAG: hypothetical protein MUD14_28930 [Hydrococcus sp. Prado102]|jgi:hypothetical protein|nr:hypothetical protein [Hydrococcus sp. Prado102]